MAETRPRPRLRVPAPARQRAAVFLDKDGTLVEDVPYNVDPEHIVIRPEAAAALRLLQGAGYRLVVVTNQSGLARGLFTQAELVHSFWHIRSRLLSEGVRIGPFYYCPHGPEDGCACRKPKDGLLRLAAAQLRLDLGESWFIGDILNDVEAGRRAGCRTALLDNGNETEWQEGPLRIPHLRASSLLPIARRIAAGRPAPSPLESTVPEVRASGHATRPGSTFQWTA